MSFVSTLRSTMSVARKEFLHIIRDRRVLFLIIVLPPAFTILLGHAFEETATTDAPTLLRDSDQSAESGQLIERLRASKTFAWRDWPGPASEPPNLLQAGVLGAVVIPPKWGESLKSGDPISLHLVLDGTDTNTAPQLQGAIQQILGEFQLESRQTMIDELPDEVIELGKTLPESVRKQFTSSMTPWSVESEILYNPKLKFIDFVIPGIVGLILQLLTVTLTACTIAREREAGTLFQLLVTPLRRDEIVIGKVLPYLVISILLIAMTLATGSLHFHVPYRAPALTSGLCFLFLLCSLGTGLLISAFCQTQTQAIQFAIFYLFPVFPLSGAFAPLEQLPHGIRMFSQFFPLTHFCHAFRMVSLGRAGFTTISGDLAFLLVGAIVTCVGAGLLLRRVGD